MGVSPFQLLNERVKEAADRLHVSVALVYALCAAKKLRHERHGLGRGVIRIPEDALDEYRKGRAVEAGASLDEAPLKHIRA